MKEVKMPVFKCLDVYNSWAILPTCAIPCAYVFCKRVTAGSETMINVAWNFSVMWDRTTRQPGMQGLMAETPLQGAGVHSPYSQTCTSRHLQLRSVDRKHSSRGRVSVPVSLRNVPSRGWLPPAQHTGARRGGCLPNSCITSDISRGSDKRSCS